MHAVRLEREPVLLADAVDALRRVKEAVRGAMPPDAEVSVCVTGADEVRIEVLHPLFEGREAALFSFRSGMVPGYRFRAVTQGLEHVRRGRHRVCAIVDM